MMLDPERLSHLVEIDCQCSPELEASGFPGSATCSYYFKGTFFCYFQFFKNPCKYHLKAR